MEGLEWQRLGYRARNTHAIDGRRLFAGDRLWALRRHKLRNIGALGQFDPEVLPKPVRRIILLQFRTQARRFNPDDRVRLGGVVRPAPVHIHGDFVFLDLLRFARQDLLHYKSKKPTLAGTPDKKRACQRAV